MAKQLDFPFVTQYNGLNRRVQYSSDLPSLTDQDYADECNPSWILQNYLKTGKGIGDAKTMRFGDATLVQDYQDAQYLLADCKSNFESLPSQIRAEFDNRVENYLAYVSDVNNLKDCYERNLIDRASVDIADVYPERYKVSGNVENGTENIPVADVSDTSVNPSIPDAS